jgi:benzoyl-CoA reductase/2-hydroxyglutaryl-CoA dehydratase subunit BcrC/BadD/HgdB
MERKVDKELKATAQMREVMAEYFLELNEASKKIAWCSSVGPAELLRSFGFLVYFPENHAAILGVIRKANDYIPLANAIGYSPEICSYLTSDIGAYLKGETPLMRYGINHIPKPDVLVFNTNQCRDVQDWFSFYAKEFNVPLIGVSTPRAIGKLDDSIISSVVHQLEALIEPLEGISGRKFDMDKLKDVMALSLKTTKLWKAVLETAQAIPSPWSFFDQTIHMGPAVVLRGTETANSYYKLLLEELKERIENKVAAVEGERFRLYWDGMPIWGKLRALSTQFSELGCCVVASTYCNSWVYEAFDPDEPFYSMAKAYTELFITRSEEVKERYIEKMVKDFKIDGIIFHDSKTCPNNSNNRYGMPERLQQRLEIPTLVINGDLCDLRCYSEEQTKTNIEAFVEQLEERG